MICPTIGVARVFLLKGRPWDVRVAGWRLGLGGTPLPLPVGATQGGLRGGSSARPRCRAPPADDRKRGGTVWPAGLALPLSLPHDGPRSSLNLLAHNILLSPLRNFMTQTIIIYNINSVASPSLGGAVGSGYTGLGRSVARESCVIGPLHNTH